MQIPEIDMALHEFRDILSEALAEGGSQHLLRLTDEEIAVLDPESLRDCVAPTPRLGDLSPEEREWAYATALRSLVSREAVELANIDELDAVLRAHQGTQENESTTAPSGVNADLRITPEVSLALTLRRTAAKALVVEQHTSGGVAHALVFMHSKDLYLVERVTPGGLHMFTLANSSQDAAKIVQLTIDPFDVADKDGRVQQLTPEEVNEENVGRPLNEAINSALVVGQMVLLSEKPGPLLTTYATDHSVWTVYVEQPNSPSGIEARPVSKATLNRMISRLLRHEDTEEMK
jgi:hypothetical protein